MPPSFWWLELWVLCLAMFPSSLRCFVSLFCFVVVENTHSSENKACFNNILAGSLIGWFFPDRKGHCPLNPYFLMFIFVSVKTLDAIVRFVLDFLEHLSPPGILLKWRSWLSRFGVRPGILYSQQAPQWCQCCWSGDHTLSSKVLNQK